MKLSITSKQDLNRGAGEVPNKNVHSSFLFDEEDKNGMEFPSASVMEDS